MRRRTLGFVPAIALAFAAPAFAACTTVPIADPPGSTGGSSNASTHVSNATSSTTTAVSASVASSSGSTGTCGGGTGGGCSETPAPVAPSSVVALALTGSLGAVGPLTSDGTNLYFAAGPKGQNTLYFFGPGQSPTAVAENVGQVYQVLPSEGLLLYTTDVSNTWALYGVIATGGTPTSLMTIDANPTGLAADMNDVYVSAGMTIFDDDTGGNQTNLVTEPTNPIRGMVMDASYVYWSSGDTIQRIDRITHDKTPIVTKLGTPGAMAIDGTNLYWVDGASGRVQTIQKDGGGGVVTIASGFHDPGLIAIGPTDLYWTALAGSGCAPGAFSAPRTACAPVTELTSSAAPGIVVDTNHFSWVDTAAMKIEAVTP